MLNQYAQQASGSEYDKLSGEAQAALRERLRQAIRTNTDDKSEGTVTVSVERTQAFRELRAYYSQPFTEGRREFAIPAGAQPDPRKLHQLTAFSLGHPGRQVLTAELSPLNLSTNPLESPNSAHLPP